MSKATFPAQQIRSQKTRTELIGQGQRMSNWLYNIAQESGVPELFREEARMLCDSWDKIKNAAAQK